MSGYIDTADIIWSTVDTVRCMRQCGSDMISTILTSLLAPWACQARSQSWAHSSFLISTCATEIQSRRTFHFEIFFPFFFLAMPLKVDISESLVATPNCRISANTKYGAQFVEYDYILFAFDRQSDIFKKFIFIFS